MNYPSLTKISARIFSVTAITLLLSGISQAQETISAFPAENTRPIDIDIISLGLRSTAPLPIVQPIGQPQQPQISREAPSSARTGSSNLFTFHVTQAVSGIGGTVSFTAPIGPLLAPVGAVTGLFTTPLQKFAGLYPKDYDATNATLIAQADQVQLETEKGQIITRLFVAVKNGACHIFEGYIVKEKGTGIEYRSQFNPLPEVDFVRPDYIEITHNSGDIKNIPDEQLKSLVAQLSAYYNKYRAAIEILKNKPKAFIDAFEKTLTSEDLKALLNAFYIIDCQKALQDELSSRGIAQQGGEVLGGIIIPAGGLSGLQISPSQAGTIVGGGVTGAVAPAFRPVAPTASLGGEADSKEYLSKDLDVLEKTLANIPRTVEAELPLQISSQVFSLGERLSSLISLGKVALGLDDAGRRKFIAGENVSLPAFLRDIDLFKIVVEHRIEEGGLSVDGIKALQDILSTLELLQGGLPEKISSVRQFLTSSLSPQDAFLASNLYQLRDFWLRIETIQGLFQKLFHGYLNGVLSTPFGGSAESNKALAAEQRNAKALIGIMQGLGDLAVDAEATFYGTKDSLNTNTLERSLREEQGILKQISQLLLDAKDTFDGINKAVILSRTAAGAYDSILNMIDSLVSRPYIKFLDAFIGLKGPIAEKIKATSAFLGQLKSFGAADLKTAQAVAQAVGKNDSIISSLIDMAASYTLSPRDLGLVYISEEKYKREGPMFNPSNLRDALSAAKEHSGKAVIAVDRKDESGLKSALNEEAGSLLKAVEESGVISNLLDAAVEEISARALAGEYNLPGQLAAAEHLLTALRNARHDIAVLTKRVEAKIRMTDTIKSALEQVSLGALPTQPEIEVVAAPAQGPTVAERITDFLGLGPKLPPEFAAVPKNELRKPLTSDESKALRAELKDRITIAVGNLGGAASLLGGFAAGAYDRFANDVFAKQVPETLKTLAYEFVFKRQPPGEKVIYTESPESAKKKQAGLIFAREATLVDKTKAQVDEALNRLVNLVKALFEDVLDCRPIDKARIEAACLEIHNAVADLAEPELKIKLGEAQEKLQEVEAAKKMRAGNVLNILSDTLDIETAREQVRVITQLQNVFSAYRKDCGIQLGSALQSIAPGLVPAGATNSEVPLRNIFDFINTFGSFKDRAVAGGLKRMGLPEILDSIDKFNNFFNNGTLPEFEKLREKLCATKKAMDTAVDEAGGKSAALLGDNEYAIHKKQCDDNKAELEGVAKQLNDIGEQLKGASSAEEEIILARQKQLAARRIFLNREREKLKCDSLTFVFPGLGGGDILQKLGGTIGNFIDCKIPSTEAVPALKQQIYDTVQSIVIAQIRPLLQGRTDVETSDLRSRASTIIARATDLDKNVSDSGIAEIAQHTSFIAAGSPETKATLLVRFLRNLRNGVGGRLGYINDCSIGLKKVFDQTVDTFKDASTIRSELIKDPVAESVLESIGSFDKLVNLVVGENVGTRNEVLGLLTIIKDTKANFESLQKNLKTKADEESTRAVRQQQQSERDLLEHQAADRLQKSKAERDRLQKVEQERSQKEKAELFKKENEERERRKKLLDAEEQYERAQDALDQRAQDRAYARGRLEDERRAAKAALEAARKEAADEFKFCESQLASITRRLGVARAGVKSASSPRDLKYWNSEVAISLKDLAETQRACDATQARYGGQIRDAESRLQSYDQDEAKLKNEEQEDKGKKTITSPSQTDDSAVLEMRRKWEERRKQDKDLMQAAAQREKEIAERRSLEREVLAERDKNLEEARSAKFGQLDALSAQKKQDSRYADVDKLCDAARRKLNDQITEANRRLDDSYFSAPGTLEEALKKLVEAYQPGSKDPLESILGAESAKKYREAKEVIRQNYLNESAKLDVDCKQKREVIDREYEDKGKTIENNYEQKRKDIENNYEKKRNEVSSTAPQRSILDRLRSLFGAGPAPKQEVAAISPTPQEKAEWDALPSVEKQRAQVQFALTLAANAALVAGAIPLTTLGVQFTGALSAISQPQIVAGTVLAPIASFLFGPVIFAVPSALFANDIEKLIDEAAIKKLEGDVTKLEELKDKTVVQQKQLDDLKDELETRKYAREIVQGVRDCSYDADSAYRRAKIFIGDKIRAAALAFIGEEIGNPYNPGTGKFTNPIEVTKKQARDIAWNKSGESYGRIATLYSILHATGNFEKDCTLLPSYILDVSTGFAELFKGTEAVNKLLEDSKVAPIFRALDLLLKALQHALKNAESFHTELTNGKEDIQKLVNDLEAEIKGITAAQPPAGGAVEGERRGEEAQRAAAETSPFSKEDLAVMEKEGLRFFECDAQGKENLKKLVKRKFDALIKNFFVDTLTSKFLAEERAGIAGLLDDAANGSASALDELFLRARNAAGIYFKEARADKPYVKVLPPSLELIKKRTVNKIIVIAMVDVLQEVGKYTQNCKLQLSDVVDAVGNKLRDGILLGSINLPLLSNEPLDTVTTTELEIRAYVADLIQGLDEVKKAKAVAAAADKFIRKADERLDSVKERYSFTVNGPVGLKEDIKDIIAVISEIRRLEAEAEKKIQELKK